MARRVRPAPAVVLLLLALMLGVAGCSGGSAAAPAGGDQPGGGPGTTAGAGPGGAPPSPTRPAGAGTTLTARPAAPRYAFPVEPLATCRVRYGRYHHDYPATDIYARRGCRFVAPTAGRVDEVSASDRWDPASNPGADRGGRSVAILGDDGVRYYGSHLERVAAGVTPGARVEAGQLLGMVGNSGDARGVATHLHFGISWPSRPSAWWVRRGTVPPWPYLRSWQAGGDRSPTRAVRAALAAAGARVPPCPEDC